MRDGGQSDEGGEDQCSGSKDERCPDVPRLAGNGGEESSREGQRQPHQREQEFQPKVGMLQLGKRDEARQGTRRLVVIRATHKRETSSSLALQGTASNCRDWRGRSFRNLEKKALGSWL